MAVICSRSMETGTIASAAEHCISCFLPSQGKCRIVKLESVLSQPVTLKSATSESLESNAIRFHWRQPVAVSGVSEAILKYIPSYVLRWPTTESSRLRTGICQRLGFAIGVGLRKE